MAGLNLPPSIAAENARALELYMRVSPEAASFLDCFTAEGTGRDSQIALRYESISPSGIGNVSLKVEIEAYQQAANACADHLRQAFPLKELIRRSEKDGLDMIGVFDLASPALKEVLLAMAAERINKCLKADPDYTLAYFEEDAPDVRRELERGFSYPVTAEELEKQCSRMSMLSDMVSARRASGASLRR